MLNRRCFFQATGSALLLPSVLRGEEQKRVQVDINDTLRQVQTVLLNDGLVADAKLYDVKKSKKGIIQWRWPHYDIYLPDEFQPFARRGNLQLLTAMRKAKALRGAGWQTLHHEAVVEGCVDTFITHQRALHRDLIRAQFTRYSPFMGPIPPSERTIDREWKLTDNINQPVWQDVPFCGKNYRDCVSPLTRLGPGYMLHVLDGVSIAATEDPEIDRKAEHAQLYGTAEEYQEWVMDKRDDHFVQTLLESPFDIDDLMVGYDHDLRDDIERYNSDNDSRISHLVITVRAVIDAIEHRRKKSTSVAEKKD